MSTKKKDVLTVSGEWRKHLRDWKRIFWKKERKAGQDYARKEPRNGEAGK